MAIPVGTTNYIMVITLLTLIWATFFLRTSHFCKAGFSVVTVIKSM